MERTFIRYADDFVCAFVYEEAADDFRRVLSKRLAESGRDTVPEKTG